MTNIPLSFNPDIFKDYKCSLQELVSTQVDRHYSEWFYDQMCSLCNVYLRVEWDCRTLAKRHILHPIRRHPPWSWYSLSAFCLKKCNITYKQIKNITPLELSHILNFFCPFYYAYAYSYYSIHVHLHSIIHAF